MLLRSKQIFSLISVISFVIFASGCIRLTGQASYFKKTPNEQTKHAAGFDTQRLFEAGETKGSITT